MRRVVVPGLFCLALIAAFSFAPSFAAADTVPSYVKTDQLLLEAYNTGDSTIRNYIKKQYDSKGSKGILDPTFRAQVDTMTVAKQAGKTVTVPKAIGKPTLDAAAIEKGGKTVPQDSVTEATAPCVSCEAAKVEPEPPLTQDQVEPIQELAPVLAPPSPEPVQVTPAAPEPIRTQSSDLFSDSNTWIGGLLGLAVGGIGGYLLGRNSSHSSAYNYGYGGYPPYPRYPIGYANGAYRPGWWQRPGGGLPTMYPAPGFGGVGGGIGGVGGYNGLYGGAYGGGYGGNIYNAPAILPYPGAAGATPYPGGYSYPLTSNIYNAPFTSGNTNYVLPAILQAH